MPSPWIKGYQSTDPRDTHAPSRTVNDDYRPPGAMATGVKNRWKGVPQAYPYDNADEGGGGGGDA